MDAFDHAVKRLANDQSKIRSWNRRKGLVVGNSRSDSGGIVNNVNSHQRSGIALSEKARAEAELRRKQQEQVSAEKKRQKSLLQRQQKYFEHCEKSIGVEQLSTASSSPLQLTATSIHGEGDKIALPPSILEQLTVNAVQSNVGKTISSPWFFRVAIRNPNYSFPSSSLLQTYKFNEDDDDVYEMDFDEDDMDRDGLDKTVSDSALAHGSDAVSAYVDELNHKYLAYTHCTVVEFTQDEGFIGLPLPICEALLRSKNNMNDSTDLATFIPTTRTIDPALIKSTDNNDGHPQYTSVDITTYDSSGTPGHMAYNAFDVPKLPIELSLIKNLPKGSNCRLVPTHEAVKNGFYNLPDIKLVLEQSLIRTRATLSIGDMIRTWHRGVKFDLHVTDVGSDSSLSKSQRYPAVSCINTDIEIEFGELNNLKRKDDSSSSPSPESPIVGYKLGTSSSTKVTHPAIQAMSNIESPNTSTITSLIIPEPPNTQTENIVKIQIRGPEGISGQRRFHIQEAKVHDLFLYAASLFHQKGLPLESFQLVTRFPRRVLTVQQQPSSTLKEVGIFAGQELFIIEHM